MTPDENIVDPNNDSGEKKRRNRPGRSSRRRRRKARSILLESSSNGDHGQEEDACVDIQPQTFEPNDSEINETSVVPIDRGYTLEGIQIRRREERLKLRSLRQQNSNCSEPSSRVQQDDQISEAKNESDGREESRLDPRDEKALKSQLGYIPGNAICVAARSPPHFLECGKVQLEDGEKCSKHVHEKMQKTNGGKVRNDDDDEAASPSVVKLYPIAVRESYCGGKKDGRKFKGRKRGNMRRKEDDQAVIDATDDHIRHDDSEHEESARGKAVRGWFVDSSEENNGQNSDRSSTVGQNYTVTASNQIIEPFPTLYWLTSPTLRTYISRIELSKTHNVQQMERRLQSSPSHLSQMKRAHKSYGETRWSLLTSSDKQNVLDRNWGGAIDATRGVAGIRESRWHCVKCLHAHAAHYLAQVAEWEMEERVGVRDKECGREDLNLVGKWTMEAVFEAVRSGLEFCE